MDKIRVLVVDDHPMVLQGMRFMLDGISFVETTGLAANAFEAMEILKQHKTDIVITDIAMPEISGMELTTKIVREFAGVKVIAMSTFNERSYISKMIQNGASGYLVKSASVEEIREAILSVYEGKIYMSLDVKFTDADTKAVQAIPVLSRRESEVLKLIADGFTNSQIAEALFISMHTVDSHRKNLLMKFAVNNTASLIKTAAGYNLL